MVKYILVWGSKSYAKLINEIFLDYKNLLNLNFLNIEKEKLKIKYFFDPSASKIDFNSRAFFSNDKNFLKKNIQNCKYFIVAVGTNHGKARTEISYFLEKKKLTPINLIFKKTFLAKNIQIGKGVVIMPNVLINSFSKIGDYTILNSSANIEHETIIGKGCHIMSGACISGRNVIGDFATIGANATIMPDLTIGDGAFVGAGSVVTKNVNTNEIVLGNPAKKYKNNIHNLNKLTLKILK
jgi:acetyltransferase EpsM